MARIAAHGKRRAVQRGDVLYEEGQTKYTFVVLVSGEIQGVRRTRDGEQVVVTHQPGQFTGELNLLSGRRPLVTVRVTAPGEIIEVAREDLVRLVQTDAELGEILMRAFVFAARCSSRAAQAMSSSSDRNSRRARSSCASSCRAISIRTRTSISMTTRRRRKCSITSKSPRARSRSSSAGERPCCGIRRMSNSRIVSV